MANNTGLSVSRLCWNDVVEQRPEGMNRSEWIETILMVADNQGIVGELRAKLSKSAKIIKNAGAGI